jgi:hypothetical protein
MPNVINADETYMLYSHGLIAEGDDPRPVHSRWGVYDFPAVAAAKGDINAIAYHSHKETEPRAYAVRLAQQVRQLLRSGVAPNRSPWSASRAAGVLRPMRRAASKAHR